MQTILRTPFANNFTNTFNEHIGAGARWSARHHRRGTAAELRRTEDIRKGIRKGVRKGVREGARKGARKCNIIYYND